MDWLKKAKALFATKAVYADDRNWFEVHPDDLYPHMIEFLRGVVETQLEPGSPALQILYRQARDLPLDVWGLCYKMAGELDRDERALRARALEICRLWYTEHQHATIGHKPMGLRIARADRWRL
jgi:hypothetical protein